LNRPATEACRDGVAPGYETRKPACGRTLLEQTADAALEHESYTTINADAHPLMGRMHKPDPKLGRDQQDKRPVIPNEAGDFAQ